MTQPKDAKRLATASEELLDALVPVAFVTMAALTKIGAENDLSLTLLRVLSSHP